MDKGDRGLEHSGVVRTFRSCILARAPERSPENIVQLLFMNNRTNSRDGEQTKMNSRGGEQTVGLEQPPGTSKDP